MKVTRHIRLAGGEKSPPVVVSADDMDAEFDNSFIDINDPPPRRYEPRNFDLADDEPEFEENQVLKDYKAKLRKHRQDQRYKDGSQAKKPSRRQWTYLNNLLGWPGEIALESYIYFANGCSRGLPITSIHFVNAIELAKGGANQWGDRDVLQQLTENDGPLWTGQGPRGARQPWTSRGRKRNP